MSYPGQGNRTYGNYRPPNHPPPNQGQYNNYGPPPGPPPNHGYNHHQGYSQQQGNNGSYGPPSGPPPGAAPLPNYGSRPSGYGTSGHGTGYSSSGHGTGYSSTGYSSSGYSSSGYSSSGHSTSGHNYSSQQNSSYGRGNENGPAEPSFQPQSFGNQAQGMPSYQYSNCQGKRKALCIGINYIGSKNALRGCINDANAVSAFLKDRYGYKEEDMVILTDDKRDAVSVPTRANIIRAMGWLVSGAQPNDTLFFHYSGHGGQTKDLDGDEDDGYDEVIYPVDFQQAGHIVDDEIHEIMVRPLKQGVRLTGLFDSCHSGTVMDLPYLYSTKGVLKEPNLAKEAGQGLLGAFMSYERGDMKSMISNVSGLVTKATRGNSATQKSRQIKTSPADVIQISGCKDDQTSADAYEAGTNTGAMSYSFIEVMSSNPNQSYISLLNEMRNVLRGKYSQKPQLSVSIGMVGSSAEPRFLQILYTDSNKCSHPLDMNLKFIM